MINLPSFEIEIDLKPVLSKSAMIELGEKVFVPNYRERMKQGLGVDSEGNLVSHKPLKSGGSGRVPLVGSGKMMRSFRVNRSLSGEGKLVLDFPEGQAEKALMHHRGNPDKGIPARPHIGLSNKDMEDAVRCIEETLIKNAQDIFKIKTL